MRKISTLSFINKLLVAVVYAVIPINTMAHAGHDHHHWLSGFYHMSAILVLGIALFALLHFFFKRTPKIKCKKTNRG